MQLYEHVYNIFTVLPCNTGLQLLRQTQLPRWFRRLGEKLNQWWWWWRWKRKRGRPRWRWQKLDKLFETGQSKQSQCNRRSKIGWHRQFPQISPGRSCSGSSAVKQVEWRLFQSRICSKTSQELELFDSTALPSLCENRSLAELIWTSTT